MNNAGVEGLEIVRADIADAEAILALQRLAYQREAELYQDPDLPPLKETLAELQETFQTHLILKALVAGDLAGSVRAHCAGKICFIGRLMVHPRLQGQGIGTALMRRIEAGFAGAEQFRLFTGARSDANIRLYRRLGYQITGAEHVDDRVQIVIMTKPGSPV